ncbi:MAG: ATP-binding protein [Planctomycetes bacterium]|nr:ATP-binding protein [Planctomycetota bacterium]
MQFQPATKAQAKLRAALTGPAGSGKTCSALRMATGIGGRIAVIDTERGSASKYADRFKFDTCQLLDRTIEGYLAAIETAAKAGYDVLIVDSLSHAWQELLQEVDRLAKARFSGNTWAAWSEGTPKQRRLIDAILDWPGHVIATMRSKTEWNQQTDEKTGRLRPVRIGLAPEQGKGCEYEFDLLLELATDHIGTVIKDRTGKFQDKTIEKPDEAFGQALAEWLSEGTPAKPPVPATTAAPEPLKPAAPAHPAGIDLSRLKALVAEHNLTEQQQAAWCTHFKVERLDQLTQHQVDAIVAKVERSVAKGA